MKYEADIEVLNALASGLSVAFIGSGPSNAMHYPTWAQLVTLLQDEFDKEGLAYDRDSLAKLLKDRKYPEALRCLQGEHDKAFICSRITSFFHPGSTGTDELYKVLTQLPFSCYLTTNYDDEITKHLCAAGRKQFQVAQNRKEDFATFMDDMRDIVYKVHGDLSHPDDIVLTSEDYTEFTSSPSRAYFRKKLQALFAMKRCLFVGYSLNDRDFSLILEELKQVCNELAPAYIFIPEASEFDKADYAMKYGIRVISYHASERHKALTRRLQVYLRFLSNTDTPVKRMTQDSWLASQLYMFRKINHGAEEMDLSNFVLMKLPDAKGDGLTCGQICGDCCVKDEKRIAAALKDLGEKGLVRSASKGRYFRTEEARILVEDVRMAFQRTKEFAFSTALDKITSDSLRRKECQGLLEACLNDIFERRGESVASSIFNRSDYSKGAKIDILSVILEYVPHLHDESLGTLFVEAVHDFIARPTSQQKSYLASLSQGYFLYHAMSDQTPAKQYLRQLMEDTTWFVDSNLLLPLVAKGCSNHSFACCMFERMKALNAKVVVTASVVKEVLNHLAWALENNPDDRKNLSATLDVGDNGVNLFVDGYVRLNAQGRFKSFAQYASAINVALYDNASRLLKQFGIIYQNPRAESWWNEVEFLELKDKLEQRRRLTYSFRRDFQVETDAELLLSMRHAAEVNRQMNNNCEIGFLSQSTLFQDESPIIRTWTGEAMYRLLDRVDSSLSSPETLHECLQNELYTTGLRFIDEERYKKFFAEDINQADLAFESQKGELLEFLLSDDEESLSEKYYSLPELQRPIFMAQMYEKERRKNESRIAELTSDRDEAYKAISRLSDRQKVSEDEIENLRDELNRKNGAVTSLSNRVRNLESGKAYQKLQKKNKKK